MENKNSHDRHVELLILKDNKKKNGEIKFVSLSFLNYEISKDIYRQWINNN